MSRAIPPHWAPSDITSKIAQAAHANRPTPRLGRKGFLFLQKSAPSAAKPPERVKIVARRMVKAERDERMDVTHALTPVKQYMAGFTRPTDLRTSNWFPGGAYVAKGKVYESPVEEAYQSHTVFILESRYHIRYGVGRVDAPDYIYGVCQEQDLPGVLKAYNSPAAPRWVLEDMDNARWPQGPQRKPQPRQKWWADAEDLRQTLRGLKPAAPPPDLNKLNKDEWERVRPQKRAKPILRSESSSNATIPPPDRNPSAPSSARAFHSSSTLLDPHNIVPDFYVQHKQAKAGREKDAEESDGGELQDPPFLMRDLSDGILSDEIEASTRRQTSKIPVEFEADGVIVHPSGFVVPTPSQSASPSREPREGDVALQTAAVAERVAEEDLADVTAETSSRKGKVPSEVRLEDGTVSHPSGFEPPTAADEFEHSHLGARPLAVGGSTRGLHTTALVRAAEAEWDFERARAADPDAKYVPRAEYMPTLAETPFWRPLVTLTVSTRPLAYTLLRLAKGLPTGRPFHAAIDNADKKCRVSYVNRMRALRLRRAQELAVGLAGVLGGLRGGVVGIRFGPDCMGRGVAGEGLADPVPHAKRVVGVGVGRWWALAGQWKELLRDREDEVLADRPFEIYDLDEFGNRYAEGGGEVVPWRAREETKADRLKREPWFAEYQQLHRADKYFARYAQALASRTDARVGREAKTKRLKAKSKPAAAAVAEDEDSDDELRSDDEDNVDAGAADPTPVMKTPTDSAAVAPSSSSDLPGIPTVMMTPEAEKRLRLRDPLDDGYLTTHAAPDFVLYTHDGKLALGPRDPHTGEILTEGARAVQPHLARVAVKRRLDMLCCTKTEELGTILAARNGKVDTPSRLND
ncbi:hypothetical protein B0H14DRAFT_1145066 [Mycena olivaceomarginata]|nr:hypothetical protein B0H14DRAFT_1145066 [Mycena olivaceomarginata]